jgi:hypothetical protein
MAIEERFTELPAVSNVFMSDIICEVQGYVSPTNLGLSVQATLQQVYNLFKSNIVLSNAGNPNGVVAGVTYGLCWDTTDAILFVCTVSGTATTAVWEPCIPSTVVWIDVFSATQAMAPDNNYVTDNGAGLVTFTLPVTAAFGTTMEISGKSSGGWTLAQNASQTINMGNMSTTTGIGGSISSTDEHDYIKLLCVTANTAWNVIGSMGMLTIV